MAISQQLQGRIEALIECSRSSTGIMGIYLTPPPPTCSVGECLKTIRER